MWVVQAQHDPPLPPTSPSPTQDTWPTEFTADLLISPGAAGLAPAESSAPVGTHAIHACQDRGISQELPVPPHAQQLCCMGDKLSREGLMRKWALKQKLSCSRRHMHAATALPAVAEGTMDAADAPPASLDIAAVLPNIIGARVSVYWPLDRAHYKVWVPIDSTEQLSLVQVSPPPVSALLPFSCVTPLAHCLHWSFHGRLHVLYTVNGCQRTHSSSGI